MASLLAELLRFPDVKPEPMMAGLASEGGTRPQPWTMAIYGQSAEMELIDFLYHFVRLIRPALVVELGCHLGLTTYALGRAIQENGMGRVVTCDIDAAFTQCAENRCKGLPVTVIQQSAEELLDVAHADFLFIDCGSYESRIAVLPKLKPGAVAVVHDTRQYPYLRDALNATGWPAVHFDTYRGFSIVTVPKNT